VIASIVAGALITIPAVNPGRAQDANPFQGFFGFDPSPPPQIESAASGTRITVRPRVHRPRSKPRSRLLSFCVRTCDGRYFPLMGAADNKSGASACNAFCPAAPTAVYSGASIDDARTADGKSYAKFANAFRYRSELVPNCTCNAGGAAGLSYVTLENDPTLREGDIVAQPDGLMVVSGLRRRHSGLMFRPLSKARAQAYGIAPPLASGETALAKAHAEMEGDSPAGEPRHAARTATAD
jgi:hypothetical protein